MLKTLYCVSNAYLALIASIFVKKRKNIWLIGGHNGKLYTDNAKIFHQYILTHHPEINIYWIVSKNAPSYTQIKGQKLHKGSFLSYLYFYQAKVVLFSDTLNSDIAPFSFILPFIKKIYHQTFKVYLSHGTIAFKKMPSSIGIIGKIKKDIFHSYNLAIASTPLAKEAMINYNIKLDNIVIAGSARHDTLKTLQINEQIILIAPTWRPWIQTKDELIASNFYYHYKKLLTNKKLIDYLQNKHITIHFYLHHLFHQYIDIFKPMENNYIKILSSSANIGYEIQTSKCIITDYSSICSDFYYLNKPVLFFQFDKKDYIKNIGSEIDLNTAAFGDISTKTDKLIDTLIYTIENNYSVSTLQKKGEKYFIYFRDRNNCQRIYNNIIDKIHP